MKVLLCHAYYQQQGGEDLSFEAEARLLESRGHEVIRYTLRNDIISQMNPLVVAWKTIWNARVKRDVSRLLRDSRPDVMHCTNTFPLLSPAVYYAAREAGVPVVQSLRNYRMMCPAALFLRDGRVCEDCLGKRVPWPAIKHGCYRESRAASAVVSALLALHRQAGTWRKAVTLYFTPSEFARTKHIEGGLPASRIRVKPNFLDPDPGPGTGAGGYALFVGRLSPEKGLDTLISAWRDLPDVPLRIVGDGPLGDQLRRSVQASPQIQLIGRCSPKDVLGLMAEASFLVMPSIWYETFGRTIIEAYACGTPVIVSRMGSMAELVREGETGFTFEPGNARDLVTKVRHLLTDQPQLTRMRQAARQEYLDRYTAERNHGLLLDLYAEAQELGHRRDEHCMFEGSR